MGLKLGDVLAGRYRIAAQLGRGGMSSVFLADDLKLKGKRWAVKETYVGDGAAHGSDEVETEAAKRRHILLSEAETMSRLSHPNLPDIVDYVPLTRHGFLYLVMDYIEGETLLQRFERQGKRMTERQVAELALQLCDLLDYLHSIRPEPIIHRDLKPSNLMLDASGRLRLIDFGTARSFKADKSADTVCIGTVGFAAPEQLEGRQSDPRTDLYGLGALMYFLLTGGVYYSAQRSPSEAAALPAGIAPLVLRLLRASPESRCSSAREAGSELRRWLAPARPPAGPAAVAGAAWTPPLVVAVGALYPGAGATFAALALARLLHDQGVPHAVIEPSTPRAELHALLLAEGHAPPGYRCYNAPGGGFGQAEERRWTDGHTLWLPAEPEEQAGSPIADPSYWFKLFHAIRRPVLIADIGAQWEHPTVKQLLEVATDIVYIADPFVHKLELPAVQRVLRQVQAWVGPGRRLHCFANKCPRKAEAWLRLLPQRPICVLPALDIAVLAAAEWNGRLPHDAPPVRRTLRESMQPWINNLLPSEASPSGGGGGKLLRLFQRSHQGRKYR
ncbi:MULTISPECIES: serine/threonine-protein kinase [unclassified Paenibacillus]|nr:MULTISPECIES: serine/threonine-protein kinase [unclassified Paenibacillus]